MPFDLLLGLVHALGSIIIHIRLKVVFVKAGQPIVVTHWVEHIANAPVFFFTHFAFVWVARKDGQDSICNFLGGIFVQKEGLEGSL